MPSHYILGNILVESTRLKSLLWRASKSLQLVLIILFLIRSEYDAFLFFCFQFEVFVNSFTDIG